jgi:hypothetical protein
MTYGKMDILDNIPYILRKSRRRTKSKVNTFPVTYIGFHRHKKSELVYKFYNYKRIN